MPLAVIQRLQASPLAEAMDIAATTQQDLIPESELLKRIFSDEKTLEHQQRAGAFVLYAATEGGLDLEDALQGAEMAVVHDIGKPETEDKTVWTPERILEYRAQHTSAGEQWVWDRRERFGPKTWALRMATMYHHSELPKNYQNEDPKLAKLYGFLHLLIAADRFDAFWSRPYAQQTGGAMTTPDQVLDQWVIHGRPHDIPPVAHIGSVSIDIAGVFKPLLEP
jgi:hypothetical protein